MLLTLVENFNTSHILSTDNLYFLMFATSVFLALVSLVILYRLFRRRPFLTTRRKQINVKSPASPSEPISRKEKAPQSNTRVPVSRVNNLSSLESELSFDVTGLPSSGSWYMGSIIDFKDDFLREKVNQMTIPTLILFLKSCSREQRKQIFSKVRLQSSIRRMFD